MRRPWPVTVMLLGLELSLAATYGHESAGAARESYPPLIGPRLYQEQPDSYVTDLSPILRGLASFYPEHRSELLELAKEQEEQRVGGPKAKRLAGMIEGAGSHSATIYVQMRLRRRITDNEVEYVGANTTASIKLYESLAAAEGGFRRRLETLSVQFDRFPKERGTLGEIALISSDRRSCGIIMVRRNALISIGASPSFRHLKAERKTQVLADNSMEERAIALARTIDLLLINAK